MRRLTDLKRCTTALDRSTRAHFQRVLTAHIPCSQVRELATINRRQPDALSELVGRHTLGDTETSKALRKQGRAWAQHVLESPISWILSTLYIAATVLCGYTPLTAIATACLDEAGWALPAHADLSSAAWWLILVKYTVCVIDVAIYAFLPW